MIAVAQSDAEKWGCPYCGFRSASCHMSAGGAASVSCGDCRQGYLILTDGMTKSPIGLGSESGTVYPELQQHPRINIPAHGSPDKRPDGGGEFFHSRGIGSEWNLCCFVCGHKESLLSNISAFTQCKASGERIVGMFQDRAYLDYREYEPDYVQVKIGACKQHEKNLEKLHDIVEDGVITDSKIAEARELW
jgi:hypothetical protein